MLAQSLEQPRIVKRIIEQSSEYRQVDVIGFRRQIHTVKNYDVLKNYKNITLKTIGSIPDGKYLRRIFAYLKLVFFLYGKYGIKPKKFYVFGMDLRIISALTLNKKIDYEISDIMWLYKKPPLRNILMIIDRNLAQTSNTIVFTSKGFYLKYYNKYVSKEKTVIKENKWNGNYKDLMFLYESYTVLIRLNYNKTLHTAFTGLPVFLTEAKMNFFDTTENLHGSKLAKQILFYSVL